MHDIQYAIDFVLEATLPNLPHYRMSPIEHTELQRQVTWEGFCSQKYESLCSPCTLNSKEIWNLEDVC